MKNIEKPELKSRHRGQSVMYMHEFKVTIRKIILKLLFIDAQKVIGEAENKKMSNPVEKTGVNSLEV
ncbi:MAG: hypothetical protein QXG05_01540 [Nitrososphaerota archaeon]